MKTWTIKFRKIGQSKDSLKSSFTSMLGKKSINRELTSYSPFNKVKCFDYFKYLRDLVCYLIFKRLKSLIIEISQLPSGGDFNRKPVRLGMLFLFR